MDNSLENSVQKVPKVFSRLVEIVLIMFVPVLLNSSVFAQALTKQHILCGNINSIPATPLSEAPFQFIVDSDLPDVRLLHSPNGRYVVVLRHGACDSTLMGVWDNIKKRAYGNESVSLRYATSGVCWDPQEPVVYFFSNREEGYLGGNRV